MQILCHSTVHGHVRATPGTVYGCSHVHTFRATADLATWQVRQVGGGY